MSDTLLNKYFVKKGTDAYADIMTKFNGVDILSVKGLNAQGAPMNIFTQRWVNSNAADVYVPDTVYFDTNDVEISFIVWNKYDASVDVEAVHDSFIKYMTSNKITLKSLYNNLACELVCQDAYEPTLVVLKRSGLNYITGTLKLAKVNISQVAAS